MMQATKTNPCYSPQSNVEDFLSIVKCRICKKILRNPVELRCSHIFCKVCLEQTSHGRNYTCPLCTSNTNQRSAKPAHEADGALAFVQDIWKQFQDASPVPKRLEQPKSHEASSPPRKAKPKSRTVNLLRKCSTSIVKDKMKTSDVKGKKAIAKPKKDATKSPEKLSPKKFVNKETESDGGQVVEPYKEHVLRWLQNSHNMFQRTSITQQDIPGNTKNQRIPKNLVSVSQRVAKRRSLPPRRAVEQNYGRHYRSLESLTNVSTSVTMQKVEKVKLDPKIFDSPVDDIDLQESRIEDVDSNPLTKSVICKEFEEQCLNKIDEKAEQKKVKKKRGEGKTDWSQVDKFAKLADKIDCVPKKLKVVCTKNDAKKMSTSGSSSANPDVSSCTEQKSAKISRHDRQVNDKKEKLDKNSELSGSHLQDSQFSTMLSSQQILPSAKTSEIKSASTSHGEPTSKICNVEIESILKGFELSKEEKTHETEKLTSPTIKYCERFKVKNKLNNSKDSATTNSQRLESIKENTENSAGNSNETLQHKCEQFLSQYNDLTERLTEFFHSDTVENEGGENFDKLSLIHKHLQILQPKFSNISVILSSNDTNHPDLLSHQAIQTDGDYVKLNISVQTSPKEKITQTRKIQYPVMKEQNVQTSPPKSVPPPAPTPVHINSDKDDIFIASTQIHQATKLKNTLDFIDLNTQNVFDVRKLASGDGMVVTNGAGERVETFTMAHNTEQIPLTEFITKMQVEDMYNEEKSQTLTAPVPRKVMKLTDSPETFVNSPSPVIATNKGVKPLVISDSEDEEPDAISNDFKRDDVVVCFDSDTQQELMNSPNTDKYLDDVWNRLNLDASHNDKTVKMAALPKTVDAQMVQDEIKKNTRELIEKCAEMLSHAEQKEASQKLKQSTQQRSQSKTKLSPKSITVKPSNDLKTIESVSDLMKDSIFNDDDLFENYKTPSPCTSSRDKPRSTLHNVHSDLIYKDSNASILTNILDDNGDSSPMEPAAITVLQDLQIARSRTKKISESEEDLIFSTPEATPNKINKDGGVIVEDVLLAPPGAFQDDAPKSVKENKSPVKVTMSTPRPSQRKSQIWNINQNVLSLSPIPPQPKRSNVSTPPAVSQNSALKKYGMKLQESKGKLRRVTSTPCSKSLHFRSTPSRFFSNQMPITHFTRIVPTLSPQLPPLNIGVKRLNASNISDEEDLFVPKSASRKTLAVISSSRLGKSEMNAINALAHHGLAKYSSTFDASVTHLVVTTNDNNWAKDHTIKYVRAIAAGIWVVNCKWVQDSLAQKKLLPEEFYEVYDVSGCDGPKQSRLYRNSRPLFEGFKVYIAPPFQLIPPAEVENIIRSLGGVTVSSAEALLPKDDYICLIISETGLTQDSIYGHYQEWVDKLRVATVEFEWLARSIGAYKLSSLRRFVLCTDESLCELGYPQSLLENVPCSFTPNE